MKIIRFSTIESLSAYIKYVYEEYTLPTKINNVIITGGSSKNILFDNLKFTKGITNVWWTDERYLHYKNKYRNSFIKSKKNLIIDRDKISFKNIPYCKNEYISSMLYSTEINKVDFFNFVFFSLGADNHFASLFQNYSKKYLLNQNSFFPIINNNDQFPVRITINPMILSKVDQIFCLVIGENKKQALKNLINNNNVPSRMLVKFSPNITILTTL